MNAGHCGVSVSKYMSILNCWKLIVYVYACMHVRTAKTDGLFQLECGYPVCTVYFSTIEANCMFLVVFFPHSGTRKRGENNKKISLIVLYN